MSPFSSIINNLKLIIIKSKYNISNINKNVARIKFLRTFHTRRHLLNENVVQLTYNSCSKRFLLIFLYTFLVIVTRWRPLFRKITNMLIVIC